MKKSFWLAAGTLALCAAVAQGRRGTESIRTPRSIRLEKTLAAGIGTAKTIALRPYGKAAADAGLKVGSVSWPVSVTAPGVDMKSNFGISAAIRKPLVEEVSPRGTHGYSPDNRDLLASFFIEGPGIRHGLNLGEIDMRSIAPTLARLLGVKFSAAALPPLDLSGGAH